MTFYPSRFWPLLPFLIPGPQFMSALLLLATGAPAFFLLLILLSAHSIVNSLLKNENHLYRPK